MTAADAISAKMYVNMLSSRNCWSALDSDLRQEGAASGLWQVGSGVGKIGKNSHLLGNLAVVAEPEEPALVAAERQAPARRAPAVVEAE
jgi:hypothetical protein